MKAQQVKTITGAKTRAAGENILCRQFEGRKWVWRGHEARYLGFDRRKDRVHFTAWWPGPNGTAGHRHVTLSLAEAFHNQTGVLDNALVIC